MENLKFIDLFCGIGGFRTALDSMGHSCVFSSDWDKEAQKTYKNNFGEKPEGDITIINENNVPNHDILCAGFPCQPFSISGKRLGFEDLRGNLFYDIVRIAAYHQPKYLLLENVANFYTHDSGRTLETVIRSLNDINYNVTFKVLNASNFGIPQSRKRIYFVAIRKDITAINYTFPEPIYTQVSLKNIILPDSETKHLITNRNDIVLPSQTYNIKNNNFKPIRIGHLNKGGQGERIYHIDGHAITLSAYGGGVGSKTGLYLINGVVRKLHPEECRKIMTFPENFKYHSSPNEAYKQFGNAVMPNMIKYLAENLLNPEKCLKQKKMPLLELKLNDYLPINSKETMMQLVY
jgi:DNA (cytosine-5)-methyltransferase 1